MTLMPDQDAERLAEHMRSEGVSFEAVRCRGSVRIATILKEREGRMSVLNEPGARVGVREWEEFERLVLAKLPRRDLLLCSGSLPPGSPAGGYARLARQARHGGSRCLIDAAGETLEAALEAREGLLLPNLAEAEGVLSGARAEPVHGENAPERAQEAANGLIARGAYVAVVTAGAAGAAYAEQGRHGRSGWVPAPAVVARDPIGAGDAFAAGLALQLEQWAPLSAAVSYAVAVAAAHVESGDAQLRRERVEALVGTAAA